MSDLTIQKVIIVVLLIMFLVPLFDSDNYIAKAESWDFIVVSIHKHLQNTDISLNTLTSFIDNQIDNHQDENFIIYFSTPFK